MRLRHEQTRGEARAASPRTSLRGHVKVLRVGPPSGRTLHHRITLDDGTALRVRADDVTALGIAAGAELDEETWGALRRRAQSAAALESALRLLAVRLRSRAEVQARLQRRGYPAEAIAGVITQLDGEGLLDDMRFSRAWVAGRLAIRPSGRVRLRRELQQKGVASEIIEQVLQAGLSESEERAQAVALAQRRSARYRREPPEVAVRRLAGVLQRRGFSTGAITAALRDVFGRSGAAVE
jgi:regulatory protein